MDKLSELTLRTQNSPSHRVAENLTVSWVSSILYARSPMIDDQGTRHFTAEEVTATLYMFLPRHHDYSSTTGGDGVKELRDLLNWTSPVSRRLERKAAPRRTFLYTPLHNYESVWWIVTWVLFRCQPRPSIRRNWTTSPSREPSPQWCEYLMRKRIGRLQFWFTGYSWP